MEKKRDAIEAKYLELLDETGEQPSAKEVWEALDEACGLKYTRKVLNRFREKQPKPNRMRARNANNTRRVITEEELLLETDKETRYTHTLRNELDKLEKGHYMRDSDMARACGVGDYRTWKDVIQSDEFIPYACEVGLHSSALLVWGHPESVLGLIGQNKARPPIWALA